MNVIYPKPTKTENGFYTFNAPIDIAYFTVPRFASPEKAVGVQEQVIQLTDKFADFFSGYELPEGIQGDASIRFRLFPARGNGGFSYWKTFGEIGFPNISVKTDFGSSKMSVWPKSGYILMELSGGGLTEKATDELLPALETIFDSQARIDKYRVHHANEWVLDGRVFIPAEISKYR